MAVARATLPVAPEFSRYLSHLALGRGKHRAIVGGFFYFVRRPRLRQPLLQILEAIRPDRTPLAAENDESYRSIELRNLLLGEGARDLLGQAETRDADTFAIALLDIVIDVDVPVTDRDLARQPVETISHLPWNELISVHIEPCRLELVE
jgi:hypothetical protein